MFFCMMMIDVVEWISDFWLHGPGELASSYCDYSDVNGWSLWQMSPNQSLGALHPKRAILFLQRNGSSM